MFLVAEDGNGMEQFGKEYLLQEHKVFKVYREHRVFKVLKEFKVHLQMLLDHKVLKVFRVLQDLVLKVIKVYRVQ